MFPVTRLLFFVAALLGGVVCRPSVARGQEKIIPERYIVHIENRIEEKTGQKTKLALTGFLLKGKKGIITSLHGVVNYPVIWAGRHEATGVYVAYDKLELLKVDVQRDLALLWSPKLD